MAHQLIGHVCDIARVGEDTAQCVGIQARHSRRSSAVSRLSHSGVNGEVIDLYRATTVN